MDEIISDRVIDPVMLPLTLGLFFSLWLLLPRLGLFGSALLASLLSATAFATFVAGFKPKLPFEVDALFALFISALIQCGIAAGILSAWRWLRS